VLGFRISWRKKQRKKGKMSAREGGKRAESGHKEQRKL
jgi:hypothetical protein